MSILIPIIAAGWLIGLMAARGFIHAITRPIPRNERNRLARRKHWAWRD